MSSTSPPSLLPNASTLDSLLTTHTRDQSSLAFAMLLAYSPSRGGLLYSGSAGAPLRPNEEPVAPADEPDLLDGRMWLASCTKLVTTIAVLQLVEQGKISLESKLADFVEEAKEVRLLKGFDGNKPVLEGETGPDGIGSTITVKQLLTHTYEFENKSLPLYRQAKGFEPIAAGTVDSIAKLPLVYPPGQGWEYSVALDWAGFIVERISGLKLGEYFQKHVFDPLQITDINFGRPHSPSDELPLAFRPRSAPSTPSTPSFEAPTPRPRLPLSAGPSPRPRDPPADLGGGGLHGSARSYMRVLAALLHGGVSPDTGARILKEETTRGMWKSALSEEQENALNENLRTKRKREHTWMAEHWAEDKAVEEKKNRYTWGIGGMITKEALPSGRGAGSFFWAGLGNTYWFIDPVNDLAVFQGTQILPFADPAFFDLWRELEAELYKGLAQVPQRND